VLGYGRSKKVLRSGKFSVHCVVRKGRIVLVLLVLGQSVGVIAGVTEEEHESGA
jgi:hypothetical protein